MQPLEMLKTRAQIHKGQHLGVVAAARDILRYGLLGGDEGGCWGKREGGAALGSGGGGQRCSEVGRGWTIVSG